MVRITSKYRSAKVGHTAIVITSAKILSCAILNKIEHNVSKTDVHVLYAYIEKFSNQSALEMHENRKAFFT